MSQAGYLLLERLKKYLQASLILKNLQKTRAYQFFKQIIFYAVCGSFLFINSLVWIGPICIILGSIIVIFDIFR